MSAAPVPAARWAALCDALGIDRATFARAVVDAGPVTLDASSADDETRAKLAALALDLARRA